jgi:hypothetical protein
MPCRAGSRSARVSQGCIKLGTEGRDCRVNAAFRFPVGTPHLCGRPGSTESECFRGLDAALRRFQARSKGPCRSSGKGRDWQD